MDVRLFTSGSSASNPGLFAVIVLLLMTPGKAIYETCSGKTMLKSGGLTCQDRQIILDTHNKLRQSVAQGGVANQPAAANMMELVWDQELASVAQKWASRCILAHDASRDVARFPVGQNIASTWTTRTNISPEPNFPQQITAWFNELVWGDSYLIGCGYSFYYDQSKGYTKLYVCNYGPGGNIIGARPYTVGSATCQPQSTRYQGLCGVKSYTYLDRLCSNDPTTSTAQTTVNPWKTFQDVVIAANIPQHTNNSSWYYYG
uniref:SCP domain-containing protein n=2 Tax=Timema TaxID=61471 RepID=A0A7R9F4T2_9NEOP|nr:unnamed protein product [Timema bartmani]